MNVFYLDKDPVAAAQALVDKHVTKMILETCQLLSTAHRVLDGEEYIGKSKSGRNVKRWKLPDMREKTLYKATHVNHPSAKWVRESIENYNWTVEHLIALCNEYNHRYGKVHKCWCRLTFPLASPPHNLKEWNWTEPPSAMAEEYIISDDPLTNYRNYYKNGKAELHSWKKRNPPDWIASA